MKDRNGWKTGASEVHFKNDHLEVVTETVDSPGRPDGQAWTIVRRKAAVVVAPMTRDGRIVLIRQERIPIREAIWELPAGQVDEPGELTPSLLESVALRELREETGFELSVAGKLTSVGHFYSSPGFTDERCYFFLARPVESASGKSGHHESESILDCRTFSTEEVGRMVAENEIRDANTLSMFARLIAAGLFRFGRS